MKTLIKRILEFKLGVENINCKLYSLQWTSRKISQSKTENSRINWDARKQSEIGFHVEPIIILVSTLKQHSWHNWTLKKLTFVCLIYHLSLLPGKYCHCTYLCCKAIMWTLSALLFRRMKGPGEMASTWYFSSLCLSVVAQWQYPSDICDIRSKRHGDS